MDLHTIVLERDAAVDARKYGDIVAPMLGVTRLEAKMRIRRGRGILLEDLGEEDARRLAEELLRDGIPVRCVRNEDLPLLPGPRKVIAVERSEATLRYRGAGDKDLCDLPWSDVDVVSLGAVALPEFQDLFPRIRFDAIPPLHRLEGEPGVRDLLRENLILKLNAPPVAERESGKPRPRSDETIFDQLQARFDRKLRVHADIIDAARSVWLRLSMDDFAYAHAADQLKLGEAWGFHLFVQELRTRSARAFTEISAKFQSGADLRDLLFLQLEEFHRYTQWHAVLHHLGLKPL
ncbi:MAG: hypothetical protein HYY16_10900 [Planctomycetes bacterium]|nr:hypothetical protein [Planctomycetota bacterium]